MFKNPFKKSNATPVTLYAPIDGELTSLANVPDPVFSEKMMGEGIAIKPKSSTVVAPVAGEIAQVFPTKHAVGIRTDDGVEILIHIGLETVEMGGEGFESFVESGNRVKVGDKLLTFDKDLVNAKAASDIVPIVITNSKQMKAIHPVDKGVVQAGEDAILTVDVK